MKNDFLPRGLFLASSLLISLALIAGAGCSSTKPTVQRPPSYSDSGPVPVLNYYHMLSRMTVGELGRERMVLAALPANPNTQMRMAMLLGHPRGPQDLPKATAILEGLIKSPDPESISLQALARLLADSYTERQRLDGAAERQGQQLRESQRKAAELQEKIDALTDIERSLPIRSRNARPASEATK